MDDPAGLSLAAPSLVVMTDGTFTPCSRCDKPVDPDDPATVRKPTFQTVKTMGGVERIEGFPKLYHPGCAPR